MTEFNDSMKNQAIDDIVCILQNTEGKSPLQLVQVLEAVQNACGDKDNVTGGKAILAGFLEQYVATPDFFSDIVTSGSSLTVSNVAQILARLRCDAVNDPDSEFIIAHLTYFVEYLKLKYDAKTHVCKKCHIVYSDYSNKVHDVINWALEAYNAPIYVKFESKEEWEEFKGQMIDEKHYSCLSNDVAFARNRKTSDIDNFDNSKFPIEVRVNGTKAFSDEILNVPQEEIDKFWSTSRKYKVTILDKIDDALENLYRNSKKLLKIIGMIIVVLAFIVDIIFVLHLIQQNTSMQQKFVATFQNYNSPAAPSQSSSESQSSSTEYSLFHSEQKLNQPVWLKKYGPWRAGTSTNQYILEVDFRNNRITGLLNLVTVEFKTDITNWTVEGNFLYAICEDKTEWMFYIDDNNKTLLTSNGIEFEPFTPRSLWY